MRIVVGTNNNGKLKEIKQILSDLDIEVVSMAEIGVNIEVEEDGQTFRENAIKKATEIMNICGEVTLADDSGLEVDSLGGAPGVYSARYAGENASDLERNAKLLRELEGVPLNKRTARFVCVLACVFPNGEIIEATGKCEGHISFEPKGTNGFGYDPLFYIEEYDCTMAELDSDTKNKISHRAMALGELRRSLAERN